MELTNFLTVFPVFLCSCQFKFRFQNVIFYRIIVVSTVDQRYEFHSNGGC